MTDPRFVVTELVGYPSVERADGRGAAPVASYFVQDTLRMWAVVRTFRNYHRQGRAYSKMKAELFCGRLNKAWDAECASG